MTAGSGTERREPPAAPCPICRKPAREAFAPFCSQRCADVDLGRWLGERYVIAGPDTESGEDPDAPAHIDP